MTSLAVRTWALFGKRWSSIDQEELLFVMRGIDICESLAAAVIRQDATYASLEGCDADEFAEISAAHSIAGEDVEQLIEAYRAHFIKEAEGDADN